MWPCMNACPTLSTIARVGHVLLLMHSSSVLAFADSRETAMAPPPQEAWLLLHALAQHGVGNTSSYVPTTDSAQGPSKEQESVKSLCEKHWRLCVKTCRSADCVRSVLSCAGLAGRGLADAAVEELVQRRCEVQQQRLQERCTNGLGCNITMLSPLQPIYAEHL